MPLRNLNTVVVSELRNLKALVLELRSLKALALELRNLVSELPSPDLELRRLRPLDLEHLRHSLDSVLPRPPLEGVELLSALHHRRVVSQGGKGRSLRGSACARRVRMAWAPQATPRRILRWPPNCRLSGGCHAQAAVQGLACHPLSLLLLAQGWTSSCRLLHGTQAPVAETLLAQGLVAVIRIQSPAQASGICAWPGISQGLWSSGARKIG